MALPPSAFFSEVLDHCGLQPHNIAPNSILVLAGFTAVFEGYLCIRPSLDFFRYCFRCWRQIVPDGGLATCGSITFNCRQGRQWYPKASLRVSAEGLPAANLAFRFCSLVKSGLVKAVEGVPMHTHDNPPLEVDISLVALLCRILPA